MRVVLVPHTHWDREWYEPFPVFRDRLVTMFDSLLDLLAREPRFRHFHLDGQTAMIEDYLGVRPERGAEIRARIREGRLSAGPLFTQADEYLTSGESTIRNLEWGLAHAAELGAARPVDGPSYAYLPDQFGHVGQMPQLLRSLGFERVVVTRGVPAVIDRSAFRWRAPDGSEILAEYLVQGYLLGADLDVHVSSVEDLAGELSGVVSKAASVSERDVVLVPVGSDHTGPPRALFELLDDAAASVGVVAEVGSIARFMADAPPPEHAQVWTGELRAASHLPLLPNVYSTRPHEKRRRAQVEHRVERYAEPLAALVPGMPWPADRLRQAWRRILWNATHDSAYGAYHDQVGIDVLARCADIDRACDAILGEALRLLGGRSRTNGVLRWNPSPFAREGVPGLGWGVVMRDSIAAPQLVELAVEGDALVLDDGTRLTFTDEADDGDLFTFCPPPGGVPVGPESITILDVGRARVLFDRSSLELTITRRGDEPFARVHGAIDNTRTDHRLAMWIQLDAAPAGSTALVPFELVDRPLVGEGFHEEIGSPTWPARGVVMADGTALLAEGTLEYEVRGDWLGVFLLRAVGVIAKASPATRPVWAGPPTPTPAAQCPGRTEFAHGIARTARRATLVETWERFALPLLDAETTGGGTEDGGQLLAISDANLSSVRRLQDGALEVRIWNDRSDHRHARVSDRTVRLGPHRIETVRLGPIDADA